MVQHRFKALETLVWRPVISFERDEVLGTTATRPGSRMGSIRVNEVVEEIVPDYECDDECPTLDPTHCQMQSRNRTKVTHKARCRHSKTSLLSSDTYMYSPS